MPTTTTTTAPTTTAVPEPAPTVPDTPPMPGPPAVPDVPAPPTPDPPVERSPEPAPPGLGAELLAATNGDRTNSGLAGLGWHSGLAVAAQRWAEQMASGTGLVHQDLDAVFAYDGGLQTIGENILSGPGSITAAQMEGAWMNSPSHRDNILKPDYSVMGAGWAVSADGTIWVSVVFGGY